MGLWRPGGWGQDEIDASAIRLKQTWKQQGILNVQKNNKDNLCHMTLCTPKTIHL